MNCIKCREEVGEAQAEMRRPPLLKLRSSKVFILSVVSVAIFTDIFLYGVIVPVLPFALEVRVGVPTGEVQHWVALMLAVYAAGLLAFSPIWGWYADHTKSRSLPFLLGLVALVAATALLCIGNSVPIIMVGRLLQGISAALVWTVGLAIVSDTVGKDNLGEAMGWVTLGIGVGIFLAPMLGGVVYGHGGYYAVFGMAFALIVLDIVMRLLMIEVKVAQKYLPPEETPDDGRPTSSTSNADTKEEQLPAEDAEGVLSVPPRRKLPTLLILLRSARLCSGLWGCLAVGVLMTSFDSVLPLYVNKIFGWDSTGAGLVFLAICIPSFFEPAIGGLGDRIGTRWIVVTGFVGALPFFVLLRYVYYDSIGQKVLLCALLVLIGFCISCVMPPLLAETTHIVIERERDQPDIFGGKSAFAQAYALFNMAYAGGTLIGPLWAGLVAQQAGWATMAWSLGLLSAVTAIPMAIWTGGTLAMVNRQQSVIEESQTVETQHANDSAMAV